MAYRSPEPIAPRHELSDFDWGEPALDQWLKRHARSSHAGGARVYVTTPTKAPTEVVGYYALAAAQVEPAHVTERLGKGQPSRRAAPVRIRAIPHGTLQLIRLVKDLRRFVERPTSAPAR